jgi:hypothetical protein
MLRRHRWVLLGIGVVVLAPIVGTFLYLNVLRDDPPARLSLDDVPATTGADTTTIDPAPVGIAGTWALRGASSATG